MTAFFNQLTGDPDDFKTFDQSEIDEIVLSRLVVRSLLTKSFYNKIVIHYGHLNDFEDLPGSCLFLMALETCNASVFHDVDEAREKLNGLNLENYAGEDVSEFATEAQRLTKVMQGDYALPLNTGSKLLGKLSKSSSEYFNRKFLQYLMR
jgi:hypothetical protein